MSPGSRPRAGWLFAHGWDRPAAARLGHPTRGLARLDHAGFDLFAFPSNIGLAFYDHERFAARQAARGRRLGWAAVLSQQEHFGALAASLVAEALKLPGTPPESILAAQHKLHARRVLERVAPEANLRFEPLEAEYGDDMPAGIAYPAFVKPVKAAFSVLARHVASREQLQAHTRFGRRELWVIRRLVDPFDRLCRARLPEAGSAHRMMLEEPVPLRVSQYNLDGYVEEGRVHALGVVDAICHPGTQAFMRWEYPSLLPAVVQARALDVARRFLGAIGYRHGMFNLEFFHDEATGRLSIIECNPRLASQFGDLYQRVDGIDPHAMALALALGHEAASAPRTEPTAAVAASLVYRAFDAASVPPEPAAPARAAFARAFPDALFQSEPKTGHALERDFKWTGSHHYGFVHLGAASRQHLRERAEAASALLGWPAPYVDHPPQAATPPLPARLAAPVGMAGVPVGGVGR